jgi:hypothetical protein
MTKAMKKAATDLIHQIDIAERVDTEDAIFSSKMLNAVHNMYTAINNFVTVKAGAQPIAWMVYTLDGKSVYVTDNPADFDARHRALPLYTFMGEE